MKIKEIAEKIANTEMYKQAKTGGNYYRVKNDITKRKLYIWTDKGLIEDPYKSNNKIPSSYYKQLIDQKVDYLLAKKPKMPVEDDNFWLQLIQIATMASSKGVQYVQFYIEDGELRTKLIPTEQLYPVYVDDKLVEMYRLYYIDDAEYVEHYSKTEVIVYRDGQQIEKRGHITVKTKRGAEVEESSIGWGRVPFIGLKNNDDCIYDLEDVKALIDSYDKTISDFANNLEDFQDTTWILKGFNGDLAKFTEQVKMYKAIPVPDTGDVKSETIDIPTEARETMLDKLENLIFKFGRGVNIEKLSGGSLTNVAIKSMFSNLDMKCNRFAQQVTKFIKEYVDFYNIYALNDGGVKPLDKEEEIVYEKSIIVNENENLAENTEQMGSVSEETRLKNHPWVDDWEEEKEKMEFIAIPQGRTEILGDNEDVSDDG